MSNYEIVFIISPEVADDEVTNVVSRVSELVSKVGGNVTEVSQWGRKKMTYPIKKYAEGNYVQAQFELEPGLVKELETKLRLSSEVLRHLLIRL